jgi:hypothetical protein
MEARRLKWLLEDLVPSCCAADEVILITVIYIVTLKKATVVNGRTLSCIVGLGRPFPKVKKMFWLLSMLSGAGTLHHPYCGNAERTNLSCRLLYSRSSLESQNPVV